MNAGAIPAERDKQEPIFCAVLLQRPPEFERPASLSAPIDFARRLVAELLTASRLRDLLDPTTLGVIIGEGNWISYECSFWDHLKCDSQSLRPCMTPSVVRRVLRLKRRWNHRVWFRTRTRPSLHYFVYLDEGRLKIRGHVDAAAPLAGPVTHFLRDYLPARGVGRHPAPEQLWANYRPRR